MWKKSIIFLTPPPDDLDFFEFGKKIDFRWPPPRLKLGKIWNVDYFDIVAPPLTLAKTVPKSFQTDTRGLFYSYIGHICTKCRINLTNISPIYHENQGHILVIWIWEKSEKFRPPPSFKVSLHLKCRLFWFWRWPPPPLMDFVTIWDILFWEAPLSNCLSDGDHPRDGDSPENKIFVSNFGMATRNWCSYLHFFWGRFHFWSHLHFWWPFHF